MSRGHPGRNAVSRRELLALTAFVTATAGCSALSKRLFEATAVVLPEADEEHLWLREQSVDSTTRNVDGPGGVNVTITTHTAVYDRADALGGA
jgi:hypothetical protein